MEWCLLDAQSFEFRIMGRWNALAFKTIPNFCTAKLINYESSKFSMKKIIMLLAFFLLLAVAANAQANDTLKQMAAKQVWNVISNEDKQIHHIMLIDVTDDGDACGFNVDGYTTWINVKDDKTINGIYIKVFDAYPVHSQLQDNDACRVFLGGLLVSIGELKAGSNETKKENATANQTVVAPEKNATVNETPVVINTKEEHLNIWQMIIRFFADLFK